MSVQCAKCGREIAAMLLSDAKLPQHVDNTGVACDCRLVATPSTEVDHMRPDNIDRYDTREVIRIVRAILHGRVVKAMDLPDGGIETPTETLGRVMHVLRGKASPAHVVEVVETWKYFCIRDGVDV